MLQIFATGLFLMSAIVASATGCGSPTVEPITTSVTQAGVASTLTTTEVSSAEELLGQMTLRQKAAQVLLLQFSGGTSVTPEMREFLKENPPGGLMLMRHHITGEEQLTSLTSAIQDAAAAGGSPVKVFIAVDQEGGDVQRVRYGVPKIPSARYLGVNSTPQRAGELAAELAEDLLAMGVNMNLAPVADVVARQGAFLYGRSYGGDPFRVASFVKAVTNAFHEKGLFTVLKHFPGHGSAPGNSHTDAVISEASPHEFRTVHLIPFAAGINAGAECVIVGHIVARAYDPDHAASSSRVIIQDLLRDELGFTGIAVSGAVEMTAARMEYGELGSASAAVAAQTAIDVLNAGWDMALSTSLLGHQKVIHSAIVKAVETGELDEDRLDEAVLRILTLKLSRGLAAD